MKWVVLVLVVATLGATADEVARVSHRGHSARRGARRGFTQVTTQIDQNANVEEVFEDLTEVPLRSSRRESTITHSPHAARGRTSHGGSRQESSSQIALETFVTLDAADTSQDRQESSIRRTRPRRPQPRPSRIGPKRSRVRITSGSEVETNTEVAAVSEVTTGSGPADTAQDDEGSPPTPTSSSRTLKPKRPSLGRFSLRRKGNVQEKATTELPLPVELTLEQEIEAVATVDEGVDVTKSNLNDENTQKIKRPSLRRRPSLKRKGPSQKTTTTEAPPVVDESHLKDAKAPRKLKGFRNRRPSLNNRASNRRNKPSPDKDMMEKVVTEVITEDEITQVLVTEPAKEGPMEEFGHAKTDASILQNSQRQFQIKIPTEPSEPVRLTRPRSRGRPTQSSRSSQVSASQSRHTSSPERTIENADVSQQTFTTNTHSSITRNRSSRPSSQVDSSAHTFHRTSSSRRQPIPTQTERISPSRSQAAGHTTGRIEESHIASSRRGRTRTGSSRGTSRAEISRESSRQSERQQGSSTHSFRGSAVESTRGRKRIETVSDFEVPRTTIETQTSVVLTESIKEDSLKSAMKSEMGGKLDSMHPEVSDPSFDKTIHHLSSTEIAATHNLQSDLVKMSDEKITHESQLGGTTTSQTTQLLPRHRFEIESSDNLTTIQADRITPGPLHGEEATIHRLPNHSAGVPLPLLNAGGKPIANKENTFMMEDGTLNDGSGATKPEETALPVIGSFANTNADHSLTLIEENTNFRDFLPDNLRVESDRDTIHSLSAHGKQSPRSSLTHTGRGQSTRNFQSDVAIELSTVSYLPDVGETDSSRSYLPEVTEEQSLKISSPETVETRRINAPASRTSSSSRSRSRTSESRGLSQQQHISVGTSATSRTSESRGSSQQPHLSIGTSTTSRTSESRGSSQQEHLSIGTSTTSRTSESRGSSQRQHTSAGTSTTSRTSESRGSSLQEHLSTGTSTTSRASESKGSSQQEHLSIGTSTTSRASESRGSSQQQHTSLGTSTTSRTSESRGSSLQEHLSIGTSTTSRASDSRGSSQQQHLSIDASTTSRISESRGSSQQQHISVGTSTTSRTSESRGSSQQQHTLVGTSTARGSSSSRARGSSSSSRVRQGTQHQHAVGVTSQDSIARGRTHHEISRDSVAQVRAQQETSRGSATRVRTQQETSRGSTARRRTQHEGSRDFTTGGRTQHEISRDSTARGRTQQETSRGSTTRVRVQQEASRDSTARGRIQQETSRSRQRVHSQSPENIGNPAESLAGNQEFGFSHVRANNFELTDSSLTSGQSNFHQPRGRAPLISSEQTTLSGDDALIDAQAKRLENILAEPSVPDSPAVHSQSKDSLSAYFEDYETETEPSFVEYLDIGEDLIQGTAPVQDEVQDIQLMADDAGFVNEMPDDFMTTDSPDEGGITMPMLSDGELGMTENPESSDMNVHSKQEFMMHKIEENHDTQFTDESSADLFNTQSRFAQPRLATTTSTTGAPILSEVSFRPITLTRTSKAQRTNVSRGTVQRTRQSQVQQTRSQVASSAATGAAAETVPARFGRRTSRGRLIE